MTARKQPDPSTPDRSGDPFHEIINRKVEESTRLAWSEWTTSQQRVDLLENAVAIASEVFEARQKLREAGRETVINVLDAENEVYNARINLTQARATFGSPSTACGKGWVDWDRRSWD